MDPETGRISPVWEFVAGGTAGGCQVVSTSRLVLPMRNCSGCCAGFHEPTRNCVGAIQLIPYAPCAHMKIKEDPITGSGRGRQGRGCCTTRCPSYRAPTRALGSIPWRVGVSATGHPIFSDIFPYILSLEEGLISRRISRQEIILFGNSYFCCHSVRHCWTASVLFQKRF
jgi:hypothetical protein